jgi:hypothetical protein
MVFLVRQRESRKKKKTFSVWPTGHRSVPGAILSQLVNSLGLNLTVFFGLLSIALSVILYLRGTRRKRLTFTYDLTELLTRSHPDITILFKDKQIENLYRLRGVIWNSGNQEVRRSDIPANGAPSIVLTRARVLSVAMREASAKTRCAAVQNDSKTVSIDFEFLNPGDYAALEILYESDCPKSACTDFVARVIGGRPSEIRHFEKPLAHVQWIAPIAFTSVWCLGALYFVREVPKWVHSVPSGFEVEPNAIFSLLALVIGLFVCWIVLREYFRRYRLSRVPPLVRHAFGYDAAVGVSSKETMTSIQD